MAQARRTSGLFGTAAGVLTGAAVALTPVAGAAQDATPVAYTQPTITAELEQQEAQETLAAIRGAAAFARSCDSCVGIIFAKGDDFRKSVYDRSVAYLNERGAPLTDHNMEIVSAQVEEAFLRHYEQQYAALFAPMSIQIEMHPRTDYASEGNFVHSGVNFYTGRVVYEDENGATTFLLDEVDARFAVAVVEDLSYMWQNDPDLISQLDTAPTPASFGG